MQIREENKTAKKKKNIGRTYKMAKFKLKFKSSKSTKNIQIKVENKTVGIS